MKIVHVYAQNIQMFADAVEGTECRLNASKDIDYLLSSLQQYNVRDVLGLIVFANPLTKKCIKLLKRFDDLFVFKRLNVVVISDNATELNAAGYFKLKHSNVYVVDSEDNSISDIELNAVFTTLIAATDTIYDLSVIPAEKKVADYARTHGEREEKHMSPQLVRLLQQIERGGASESVHRGHNGSSASEGETTEGPEISIRTV